MRALPKLLLTTSLCFSLALPAHAQAVQILPRERAQVSPLVGGLLLALLMFGVAGLGPDKRSTTSPDPTPDPDPEYSPPGGFLGPLRPRYVVGVTPFGSDPILGDTGNKLDFETPEYKNSWGLGSINASARYAAGASGDGALISIFDTGVLLTHKELSGQINTDLSHSYYTGEMTDTDGHGTHVAGIIAGVRDGIGIHGVAPDATLMAFRAISGPEADRDGTYVGNWEDAILRSVEAGADVMNNSWTFIDSQQNPIRITSLADRDAALAYFGSDLMGTFAYAAQQDLVSVFAAGNGNGGESSVTAGLPALIEELRGHWVSVVALNSDDTIADYSSRCGVAADWCLSAPGTDIVSSGVASEYEVRSGTSMAAGFVSGSLALLKSNFPEITGATALQILKDTARDLGDAGVDPIFGYGAIDLETAMLPAGTLNVQMSGVLNEQVTPLSGTGIVAPAGISAPLQRALTANLISATDAYDRAYSVDMGGLVTTASAAAPVSGLTQFTLKGSAGVPVSSGTFLTTGAPVADHGSAMPGADRFWGGHASLVGPQVLGISHATELADGVRVGFSGAADMTGKGSESAYAALNLSTDLGKAFLSMEAGQVREHNGLLGARFQGAFSGVSAETRFLRASADLPLGRTSTFHLTASSGETDATGSGLIRSGKVSSESFGIGVSRRNRASGSVMSLGLSRPLSISGGALSMAVPVGVAAASGGVASEQVRVESLDLGLEGASAPMDLQFGYEVPVGEARFAIGVSHRVGSDLGSGTSASFGVSMRF